MDKELKRRLIRHLEQVIRNYDHNMRTIEYLPLPVPEKEGQVAAFHTIHRQMRDAKRDAYQIIKQLKHHGDNA